MKMFICIVICVFLVFSSVFMVVMMFDIVMVGGVLMCLSKNIIENVVNLKDYIILVVVVKVVGLVDIL